MLVVDNIALPTEPRSTATDPQDRKEEDLVFGARDTLENIRRLYGVTGLMRYLKSVARYFEVDDDDLLKAWVRHYGPGFVAEAAR